MNARLRDIIAAALVGAGITFGLGGVYVARADTPPASPQEDEPGWDCRVDGNRICGDPVQQILGTPPVEVLVSPSLEDLMLGGAR